MAPQEPPPTEQDSAGFGCHVLLGLMGFAARAVAAAPSEPDSATLQPLRRRRK
jgi:hypothetical protein